VAESAGTTNSIEKARGTCSRIGDAWVCWESFERTGNNNILNEGLRRTKSRAGIRVENFPPQIFDQF
jgi:hypothetical protein